MMDRVFLVALIFGFCIFSVHAQEDNDTTGLYIESQYFENNMDSLLHIWYVQKAIENQGEHLELLDTLITGLDDSVYMARLNAMQSMVPFTYNERVRNWINMYEKRRTQMEAVNGLAEYYFPMFEEILDAHQMPLELKYLAVIESALNPRAVSRAGATGLWQFMYGTGRMYQLHIDSYVDERRDPLKSSQAAARYLKDLYNIYGDWILVIAAYNCGPGNVNKAIRRSGGKRDFWEIYHYLPRETRGYVPAFIAASYIMHHREDHHVGVMKIELPLAADTVMIVNQKLHLRQVSEVLGIPYEQLRDMNPQYRKDIIPARAQGYALTLPVQYMSEFIALQDSILTYKDSIYLNPAIAYEKAPDYKPTSYSGGSGSYAASSNYTPPSTEGMEKLSYTVKSGDVLSVISGWYGVGTSDIKYWNNLRSSRINVGQKLVIYVPKNQASKYDNINSLSLEQKKTQFGKTTSVVKTVVERDPDYIYYTIKSGDNLWEVAKKFPGVSNQDIMRINGLTSTSVQRLRPGDVIKIKKKSS